MARKKTTKRTPGAYPEIGQRLRDARVAADKSQSDIADELGKTQPTVSSWESGHSLPDTKDVREVAASYGLHPMQLLPERRAA